MSHSVFGRIIEQLSECSFSGRLSYHLYNEPLLRRDLEVLVAHADAALPDAYQVIYTNGDLLSEARYARLVEAGMDHIIVTRHDGGNFPERPRQTVLRPNDLQITNRGGYIFDISNPLRHSCYAPSEMLIVAYNGDVLACYEDARREHIMGSLVEQTLAEVWTGERFATLRRSLETGDRSGAAAICKRCSNCAHTVPGRTLFAL